MMSGHGSGEELCVTFASTVRLRDAVMFGMLACATGLLAGCGSGGVAPVQAPSEPTIAGPAREHIVGKGETVYAIAWRHGLDYRVLARHNSIRDPYTIFPGQRLLIPQSNDASPSRPIPSEGSGDGEAPAGASTRGTGTQPEPAIVPLPPPPASPPPETGPSSAQVSETTSEITSEPQKPAPAPSAAPSPAEPMAASLPHRTVAGVRWTWPTNGRTIGSFAGAGGKGLDIVGAPDQPIRAAAQGRVVYAGGGLIGYGKLIILKHNSRLLSAYAHNERLHVKEGDAVKGGHHIADMGRSSKGRSMLHFEIRRDGIPVDPVRYLP